MFRNAFCTAKNDWAFENIIPWLLRICCRYLKLFGNVLNFRQTDFLGEKWNGETIIVSIKRVWTNSSSANSWGQISEHLFFLYHIEFKAFAEIHLLQIWIQINHKSYTIYDIEKRTFSFWYLDLLHFERNRRQTGVSLPSRWFLQGECLPINYNGYF